MARVKQINRRPPSNVQDGLAGKIQLDPLQDHDGPLPGDDSSSLSSISSHSEIDFMAMRPILRRSDEVDRTGDEDGISVPNVAVNTKKIEDAEESKKRKRGASNSSPSANDEIIKEKTAMDSTNKLQSPLLGNVTANAENRIKALETTLEILQSRQEKLQHDLKIKEQRRSELGGTRLLEPGSDVREGPVFAHYSAKEKERRKGVEKRVEKVKKDLRAARAKQNSVEVDRLEERMGMLMVLLKEFDEDDTEGESDASEVAQVEEGERDMPMADLGNEIELSPEDSVLLELYERYAEPFWREIAARFDLAGGPPMSTDQVEQRIMALKKL